MKEVFTLEDLRTWNHPELRLAVCGDPVAHSASPPMHNAALAACGLTARYTRLHLRPAELAEAFALLPRAGFLGVNCTIPHKPAALRLVHSVDASARRAGGVNTVRVRADGTLEGHSTDGEGFARAVQECFGTKLAGLRVAVLGAGGGAGRAIAMQCAWEGAATLALLNRTAEKAAALAADITRDFPQCRVACTDERALAECDLIVNCTALGMCAEDASPVRAEMLRSVHLVYDTIYTAARTPLMKAADSAGAKSANGLAMLLHQGARSFEIWFEREAPIEVMRAALLAAAPR
jgi:shikimate dehydrogenase